VRYVMGVHEGLGGSEDLQALGLSDVDAGLFLHAWLCLLTREFGGAHGSALIPLIEFFNHCPGPGADQEWDDEADAVVVRARRAHAAGEEVFISYAPLSNPILFRTYGFTVPPEVEPTWTCTFVETEVLQAAPPELADHLAALPNLHIEASVVTDTLATVLAVCANHGHNGTEFLHRLCASKAARYEGRSDLGPALASLRQVRAKVRSDAAWWVEQSAGSAHDRGPDALRVQMSEYLCLTAHLEALDFLAGCLSEDQCLQRAEGLRQDLLVLRRAGIIRPAGAQACEKTAGDAVSEVV